jgi:predicted nucleic-acid-binding protein
MMIVIADTNIIARLFLKKDNEEQRSASVRLIRDATKLIIPIVVFCELAWILSSRTDPKMSGKEIADAIHFVLNLSNLVTENDAVLSGLRMLDDGGDFADGVVQYTGSQLADGPSTYASFDQEAVRRLSARGIAALIPH